jgi:hypothetical protein
VHLAGIAAIEVDIVAKRVDAAKRFDTPIISRIGRCLRRGSRVCRG